MNDTNWIALILGLLMILYNVFVFFLYAVDKYRSGQNAKRIPEKILLLSAFLFGSMGAMLFMEIARHKTDDRRDPRKRIFTKGIPLSYISQILLVFFWDRYHGDILYITCAVLYFAIVILVTKNWKSTHAINRQANSRRIH